MREAFSSKKGEATILTLLFIVGTAIFVFVMFAGKELAYWGNQGVVMNNLTGLEAFLFSNLNLLVVFGIALFTLVGGYYVGVLGGGR